VEETFVEGCLPFLVWRVVACADENGRGGGEAGLCRGGVDGDDDGSAVAVRVLFGGAIMQLMLPPWSLR